MYQDANASWVTRFCGLEILKVNKYIRTLLVSLHYTWISLCMPCYTNSSSQDRVAFFFIIKVFLHSAFCITNMHTPIIDELLDRMQSNFCKSKHLKSFVMNMHQYWFVCFLCPIQISKIRFSVLALTFHHVMSFFSF